jgi:hypothetical protein
MAPRRDETESSRSNRLFGNEDHVERARHLRIRHFRIGHLRIMAQMDLQSADAAP